MKTNLNNLTFTDLGKIFKIMINMEEIKTRNDLEAILGIHSKPNMRSFLKKLEDNNVLYRKNKFDKENMKVFFSDEFLLLFDSINIYKQENKVFDIPINNSGVYLLYENEEVVYVGKSNNMKNRITQHKKDKIFDRVICMTFENEGDRNIYELYYISKFKPKYNKDCVSDSNIELKDFLEDYYTSNF